ncbi:PEP/pyruvate-binding domain-containing protein [Desulfacinum hydrothermale]|nr:PEP/pyruvate-binding domain-containing protein [Desulfacinum hydrothermale]
MLLSHDKASHDLIAQLEDIYYNHRKVDLKALEHIYDRLSEHVGSIIDCLDRICPARYQHLNLYFKKLDSYARHLHNAAPAEQGPPWIVALDEIGDQHRELVGGKAYQLARAVSELEIPAPPGFVVTTNAFRAYLVHNGLHEEIDRRLARLDMDDRATLKETAEHLTARILAGTLPEEVERALLGTFRELQSKAREPFEVAVRSSAMAEDSELSFAGQYRTVLNVSESSLVDAYKQVIASKYSERALLYRIRCGLGDDETAMAALVLKMVKARSSGVIYTRNLEQATSETLSIHAVRGLGEILVAGRVSPDVLVMSRDPEPRLVDIRLGGQDREMVADPQGGTRTVAPPRDRLSSPCIDEAEAVQLAQWGLKLEGFYGGPLDIEWCLDQDGQPMLLQVRPLRLEPEARELPVCRLEDIPNRVLFTGGECASGGLAVGPVFRLERESDIDRVPEGAILVTRHTSPHYVQVMEQVAGVVTQVGSPAGHFASVAREFRIPVLVNTGDAAAALPNGAQVTLAADQRTIFAGRVSELQEQVCSRQDPIDDSPYLRKLRYLVNFVSPLNLTDPLSPAFAPGQCRSLHDILRFCHEKAVQEMFATGNRRFAGKRGAYRLVSSVPMLCYVLDVGNGMEPTPGKARGVPVENIFSIPFRALWQGLTHPDIHWSHVSHFNWADYDRIVMSGGIISADSAQFASYAVVSRDYLNLNLKFGYHFVILDSLCGESVKDNYILFRFTGGGADFYQRSLRAEFLRRVLDHFQFRVTVTGDLIDAQYQGAEAAAIEEKLEKLGRLLGATRLLDMRLKDASMVAGCVDEFMQGRYDFSLEDPADD